MASAKSGTDTASPRANSPERSEVVSRLGNNRHLAMLLSTLLGGTSSQYPKAATGRRAPPAGIPSDRDQVSARPVGTWKPAQRKGKPAQREGKPAPRDAGGRPRRPSPRATELSAVRGSGRRRSPSQGMGLPRRTAGRARTDERTIGRTASEIFIAFSVAIHCMLWNSSRTQWWRKAGMI